MSLLRPLARIPFLKNRIALPPTVACVRIQGVIGGVGGMRRGLSLETLAAPLETAFSMPKVLAVALLVNSPGGSPVQSQLIHTRIRQLSKEKEVPVLAFCEDVAASGGYMIALAADEIFADAASIIGSIGVISAGFGFDKLIAKYGIERRVHTAGRRKGMLDPFLPEKPDDVAMLRELQHDVHRGFKAMLHDRRSGKLAVMASDEDLTSGRVWSGVRAEGAGLIDGLGDLRSILRARYGEKVKPVVVNPNKSGFGALLKGQAPSNGLSSSLTRDAMAALEERALWGRYGL